MSDTKTCVRCGREGTQQFRRAANPATGRAEWQCAYWAPCREREREREVARLESEAGE